MDTKKDFSAYIQGSPSCASGLTPCVAVRVEPIGMVPESMVRAGEVMIVPLTTAEEAELGMLGEHDFELQYAIDLDFEALAHWYKWSEP